MGKNIIKISLKSLFILLGSICVSASLMFAVFSLPTDNIDKHVKESVVVFEEEKTYPVLSNWCTSRLDNWTDAIMLLSAAYQSDDTLVNNAMNVKHIRVRGENPAESLVSQYQNLNADTYEFEYARYWHGYLLLLKPLLIFFDYSTIRLINLLFQTLINISVVLLLYRNNMKKYILPYVFSIFLIMPLATAWSLQFSSVFYIFTIGLIILLYKNYEWKDTNNYYYFFLLLGISTSFFDFLSYPLATFGIPAVFYFCLNKINTVSEGIKRVSSYLIFWGIGYVGMWAGKWVLASLLTPKNIILEAIDVIKNRTSLSMTNGDMFTVFDVWEYNLDAFVNNPVVILIIVFIAVNLIRIMKTDISGYGSLIAILCISLLPFIWYMGASNHSYIHFWFTYKSLIVTAFAIMCSVIVVADDDTMYSKKIACDKEKCTWGNKVSF